MTQISSDPDREDSDEENSNEENANNGNYVYNVNATKNAKNKKKTGSLKFVIHEILILLT